MSLHEVQQEFACALSGPGSWPEWIESPDADERLEVYRGTVRAVLVKALSLNFPAVRRLVGTEFFEWAAALYAIDHPPVVANLDGYGGGFAEFLAGLPACDHLAYLPDVARLDWAVAKALHAEDADPLDPASLGPAVERAGAVAFVAHPAVSFLACRFPADEIWSAALGDVPGALEAIDLSAGPCWLVVERRDLRPKVCRLTRAEWEFARDLFCGRPLALALSRAADEGAVAGWIAQHRAAGRAAAWCIAETEELS
jgi:hypothetical protein